MIGTQSLGEDAVTITMVQNLLLDYLMDAVWFFLWI